MNLPKISGTIKPISVPRRRSAPAVPWEIRDAVEEWARSCGRHADIVYIPFTNPPIPQVRIDLKSDDPRLEAWQKGEADEKPVETVELVEWDGERKRYVGLNLTELGAQGVKEYLERGNTWSGRGEFDSLQEAVVAARNRHQSETERLKRWIKGEAIARAEDRAYGDRSVAKQFSLSDIKNRKEDA